MVGFRTRGGPDPAAFIVDLRKDADSTQDGAGGRRNLAKAFDSAFAGSAETEAATAEQAGGVGVTVERRAGGNGELVADGCAGAPMDEIGLDGFAVGMPADGAFADVAFERRFWFGLFRLIVLAGFGG